MSRHAYDGAEVMRRYGSRLPRVLNWVRIVRAHPECLADDGVHVSAAGCRARAKAAARIVRRCD